jgi:hypothetical protein
MKLKLALIGLTALGGVALASEAASAMPIGLATNADIASNVEQARWVCGPYRCWWRPNVYGAYGYYAGPRYYHGWGWRHDHGWGWRHRW